MNRKIVYMIMVAVMSVTILTGCGQHTKKDARLHIVTTTFYQYDWMTNILGEELENYELTLLQRDGVDLHNYQPTIQDMATISQCDLFVYGGGESDQWVEKVLEQSGNENRIVLRLMDDVSGLLQEEVIEGMEASEEHEEAHDHEETHHHEEEEMDEHVWLSLNKAMDMIAVMTKTLSSLDETRREVFENNGQQYIALLKELEEQFSQVVSTSKRSAILFGDRFPFRYMADEYNLTYYAAFVGCSAETEASFQTIAYLANVVDQQQLPYVFTVENPNHKIAETVIQNTNGKDAEILVMNSMQSITEQDIREGVTYLNLMHENLQTLKKALN